MSPDTRPAIGRNDPCHCGSGRKYKVCCLAKDEADARAARAQSAAAAPADATAAPARAEAPVHTRPPNPPSSPGSDPPWTPTVSSAAVRRERSAAA